MDPTDFGTTIVVAQALKAGINLFAHKIWQIEIITRITNNYKYEQLLNRSLWSF